MSSTITTYEQATDEQVLANYEAGCAIEVQYDERGEELPEIIASTTDEWMREGMRRGLI